MGVQKGGAPVEPIADRINEIIKAKGLKKSEFAKRLGISPASVSTMCSGKSNPSGQTVTMICHEFGVSEAWLRTGEGEMFVPAPSDELDALAKRYNLSHGAYVLIEKIIKASPEQQQAILGMFQEVAAALAADDVPADVPAFGGSSLAEAAYEKNFGIASDTDASLSSTSEGTA